MNSQQDPALLLRYNMEYLKSLLVRGFSPLLLRYFMLYLESKPGPGIRPIDKFFT